MKGIAEDLLGCWTADEWRALTAGRSGVTGTYRRGDRESVLGLKAHARLSEAGWTLQAVDVEQAASELRGARVRGDL